MVDLLLQRSVVWKEGTRKRVLNQALPLVEPAVAHDHGTTFGILNSETFPEPGDAAKGVAGPELRVEEQGDGSAMVSVSKEPRNVASYREDLPTAPPWNAGTFKKDYIRGLLHWEPDLDQPSAELLASYNGDSTEIPLVAEGKPDNSSFIKLVEGHEDRHVSDLKNAVDTILRPWDSKLQVAARQPFVAKSRETAEADFYKSVGGTAAEIGTNIGTDFRETGLKFHGEDDGKNPSIDRVQERSLLGSGYNKKVYYRLKHPLSKG
ncbi:MAG: hypothetical protein ACRDZ8_02730 [Acidimicrobiales bacterium]